MNDQNYYFATITEALVDKVESLKVEVDAQQQVIEALRSERENQGDETIQEKYLAEALYIILELVGDSDSADVYETLKYIKLTATEALQECNYDLKEV